ncbi:MAG: TrkH family potassium uptake protein [Gloeomargarita sp. HHBFW_bins_162]
MTPARTICLGFLLVISVGMVLLLGPWATQTHQWSDPVTALFTATSAVCVTGLSVVDVGTYYSFFGQFILLLLIQLGGLGYMTSMTLLFMALGRRFRLKDKLAIQQALDQSGLGGIQGLLRLILTATVVIETLGAILLWPVWRREYGWGRGLWLAIFHSISAFNNAGFSLFPDSLMRYQQSGVVVGVISGLIMLGGIGYPVLSDAWLWLKRRNQVSLNTKVVVSTSIFLWLAGWFFFTVVEFNNPHTLRNLPWPEQVGAAWFQSVTSRTAGFNTIDIGKMTVTGLMITVVLMFIGASPGGTGGGIKTTTIRVLVRATRAILRGHEEVVIYEREIPPILIYKAIAVLIGSLGVVMLMVTLLSFTEAERHEYGFLPLFFETVSAFATVGLSTGITSGLTVPGKLLLILTMYVGRVGVLLLMAAIVREPRPMRTHYPEETFLVG